MQLLATPTHTHTHTHTHTSSAERLRLPLLHGVLHAQPERRRERHALRQRHTASRTPSASVEESRTPSASPATVPNVEVEAAVSVPNTVDVNAYGEEDLTNLFVGLKCDFARIGDVDVEDTILVRAGAPRGVRAGGQG